MRAMWLGVVVAAVGCGTTSQAVAPVPFGVEVVEPRGGVVSGESVRVRGFVRGGAVAEVKVGQIPAKLSPGGAFEGSVPIGADGPQQLVVEARPAGGGAAVQATARWIADTQPPLVTVTRPARGQALRGDVVQLEGRVEDVTAVRLTLDGRPVWLDGTRWLVPVMVPAEGERLVVLRATDAAGHVAELQHLLRRDQTAPTVALGTLPDEVRDPAFVLRGVVSEPGCRVFVNGEEADVQGAEFQVSWRLDEGPNAFDVVARDAAGNEGGATATVGYRPLEPPTKEQIIALYEEQITGSGSGGWYEGQFRALEPFGRDLWPALIQVAAESVSPGGNRRVAGQAIQALAELRVTDAIPFLRQLADEDQQLQSTAVFILARLGDTERADRELARLQRLIEGNERDAPRVWIEVGDAYARMNRFSESRDSYQKAVDVAKKNGQSVNPTAYYNLACQLAKLGAKPEAMDALDQCVKLNYQDYDWMAKDGDLSAVRDDPRFIAILTRTGNANQLVRRALDVATTHPLAGEAILEKAVEKYPRDVNSRVYLALHRARAGNVEGATAVLDEAAALAPLNYDTLADAPVFEALAKLPRFQQLREEARKKAEEQKPAEAKPPPEAPAGAGA